MINLEQFFDMTRCRRDSVGRLHHTAQPSDLPDFTEVARVGKPFQTNPQRDHRALRSMPASSLLIVLHAHAMRGVLCAMPICPWAFRTMMPPCPFKRCFR
jgi:hypothetical protein